MQDIQLTDYRKGFVLFAYPRGDEQSKLEGISRAREYVTRNNLDSDSVKIVVRDFSVVVVVRK